MTWTSFISQTEEGTKFHSVLKSNLEIYASGTQVYMMFGLRFPDDVGAEWGLNSELPVNKTSYEYFDW